MASVFVMLIVCFGLGVGYSHFSKKSDLDKYYFDRFKRIKSSMIYGSSTDTEQELSDYHDQTELCMYLDGYNGVEIMDVRCKAFAAAFEGK